MTGYVRQDTSNNIADGNVINATDLDSEFDGVQAAFNASTGHVHDGTTGNGAPILVVGPTQDVVVSATAVTPKTTNTVDIGSSSLKFKDIFITGTATLPTIAATTVDTTNIEVTTLKAKDGTAAGSIADTTGVVTLASSILTTADINGGTLDNVVIGGTTAAAASVTTLTTSSTVTHNGGTANGVAYLNGSKVLTTGSALTFDGTTLTSATYIKTGGGAASNTSRLMVNTANGTAAGIQLFQDGVESWIMGMPASSGALTWANSGTEQMRLTSTGLGIGTSSPSQKLQVVSSSGGTTARFSNTNTGNFIDFYETNTSTRLGYIGTTDGTNWTIHNDKNGYLSFDLNNTEQMRLTSTGLGIGTSSPAYKLDVNGQARLNNLLWFTPSSGLMAIGASGTNFQIYNGAGAETRLTVDNQGNLGLGVTPSGWGSGWAVVQPKGGFIGSNGTNSFYIGANVYYDGSNWKYNVSDYSSRYAMLNGAHYWFTAPSGTAGNAISFTQAMTLDASGNLGVGTTSPGYKFSLQGGSSIADASMQLSVSGNVQNQISFSNGYGQREGVVFLGDGSSGNTSFGVISTQQALTFQTAAFNIGGSSDLSTGWTERARIDSSGNLSMTGGGAVNFNNGTGARPGSSGQYIVAADAGGFYQQAGGSYYLVTTTGGSTSDATLKKNVQQLSGALEKICAIRGVKFEFIEEQMSTPDNGVQVGVIAQEVEAQYPEIVVTNEDGIKSVRYEKLVAPLIEAIKELKAEFDAYKATHP